MITYRPLDLPKIPEELLVQDFSQNKLQVDNSDRNRQFTMTRDGQAVQPAWNRRWEINGALLDWIKENVSDRFHHVGYAVTQDAADHLPHRDLIGDYKIYYVVQAGGDDVVTRFYQTPNDVPPGWRPECFDDLIEIDSYRVPNESWVMVNTRILHGVTGITGQRHMVSLTFYGEMP